MGPRLVHLASLPYTLHTLITHPDSQTDRHIAPCSLLLAPCTLVPVPGPVLNRTPGPAKLDTLHFPFCNSTVPLYATTVPTLSILNLVVFPSTVADHPSLGGCWLCSIVRGPGRLESCCSSTISSLLLLHLPRPPVLRSVWPEPFIVVDHRPPASVPPASSVCGFVIGRPEPRREASL